MASDGADPVATVEVVGGFAVDKANHTGDDVGATDVGNIKAFHSSRWTIEEEDFAEVGEVDEGINRARDAEAVALVAVVASHRFGGLPQVIEHVADFGRLFEIKGGSGFPHFGVEGFEEIFGLSVEEFAGFVDPLAILGSR